MKGLQEVEMDNLSAFLIVSTHPDARRMQEEHGGIQGLTDKVLDNLDKEK